jgi:DNA repair protein RadC
MSQLSLVLATDHFSEIQVSYHPSVQFKELPKVTDSQGAEQVLRGIWSDQLEYREEFIILCLNRANRVIGFSKISMGGTAGTVADPKMIFQIALKSNAASLILCHNHPSGNIRPSEADLRLTKKLKGAGDLLDIPILDHIILTAEKFFSMADEGCL